MTTLVSATRISVVRASILLPLALIGMLNAMGTDRSAAFALEQRPSFPGW